MTMMYGNNALMTTMRRVLTAVVADKTEMLLLLLL